MTADIVLHSPLALRECEQRLRTAPSWSRTAAWTDGSLAGRVEKGWVRLRRPVITRRAATELVGTLTVADDGGTLLSGKFRPTWRGPFVVQRQSDIDYVLDILHRASEFSLAET